MCKELIIIWLPYEFPSDLLLAGFGVADIHLFCGRHHGTQAPYLLYNWFTIGE